jgi:hypothetical protein
MGFSQDGFLNRFLDYGSRSSVNEAVLMKQGY